MSRTAIVTIRVPAALKRRLESRARESRRSLSSQVVHDLERIAADGPSAPVAGAFLGRYAGTPVPADADIADVRVRLWGRLGRVRRRG